MVLAAENFGQLTLLDHALHCLSQAFCVYENQAWNKPAIDDHLHFRIVRLSFMNGRVFNIVGCCPLDIGQFLFV